MSGCDGAYYLCWVAPRRHLGLNLWGWGELAALRLGVGGAACVCAVGIQYPGVRVLDCLTSHDLI